MEYGRFLAEVKQLVQEKIGDEYEVGIRKVPKNKGVMLDGLSINLKIGSLAPVLYLNAYYEQLGSNMTLTEIVADIVSIYKTHIRLPVHVAEALSDFDNIKDKVAFKLIQAETNLELLADIPNIRFLDMAIVFYLLLDKSEIGQMTSLIHNSHLGIWGITEEEVYRLAKMNTPKLLPAKIKTMKEVMCEMLAAQFEDIDEADTIGELLADMPDKPPLYVFSNQYGTNGAGCILYEGCLAEFAQAQNSDIIILPSSIHEVLLTPDSEDMNYMDMEDMVNHINQEEVAEEDVLSNRVYRYSLRTKEITIAG